MQLTKRTSVHRFPLVPTLRHTCFAVCCLFCLYTMLTLHSFVCIERGDAIVLRDSHFTPGTCRAHRRYVKISMSDLRRISVMLLEQHIDNYARLSKHRFSIVPMQCYLMLLFENKRTHRFVPLYIQPEEIAQMTDWCNGVLNGTH